jgi:dihydroxy-acid dehydratase
MLYATEGINKDEDFNKAMIGVASVWYVAMLLQLFTPVSLLCYRYEGNP